MLIPPQNAKKASQERIPIVVVSILVIQFTGPAWMALGEALWRRRWPSWYVLLALVLTIGGVVLVTNVLQQKTTRDSLQIIE